MMANEAKAAHKDDLLHESIKRHEGLRLKPYRCTAGALTIGYGHNLDDNGISIEAAELLLEQDIDEATRHAIAWIGDPGFWSSIEAERQAVIIEMMFNMGPNRLQTFKRFRSAILRSEWVKAAREMLDSKWARQDVSPSRSATLALQMETGEYSVA